MPNLKKRKVQFTKETKTNGIKKLKLGKIQKYSSSSESESDHENPKNTISPQNQTILKKSPLKKSFVPSTCQRKDKILNGDKGMKEITKNNNNNLELNRSSDSDEQPLVIDKDSDSDLTGLQKYMKKHYKLNNSSPVKRNSNGNAHDSECNSENELSLKKKEKRKHNEVVQSKRGVNKIISRVDSQSEWHVEETQEAVNTTYSNKGIKIKKDDDKKKNLSTSESESDAQEIQENLKTRNSKKDIKSKNAINKNSYSIDSDMVEKQETVNTKKSHKDLQTKRNANKKQKHSDSESESDSNTKEKKESLKAGNIKQDNTNCIDFESDSDVEGTQVFVHTKNSKGVKPKKDNKKATAATPKTKFAPKEILKPGNANALKKGVKPQKDMDQNLKTVISESESDIDIEGTQECTNKQFDNKVVGAKIKRDNNEKTNNSTSESESDAQETQEILKTRNSKKVIDSKSDVSENSQSIDSESDTDMARIRETVNKTSNKGVKPKKDNKKPTAVTPKTKSAPKEILKPGNANALKKVVKPQKDMDQNLKTVVSKSESDIDIEGTQECANKKIDNKVVGAQIKRNNNEKTNNSTSESESDSQETPENSKTSNSKKVIDSKSDVSENSHSTDSESDTDMARTRETVNTKTSNKDVDLRPKRYDNKKPKQSDSDSESESDSNTKEKRESLKAVNITQDEKSKSGINKNSHSVNSESNTDMTKVQDTVNPKISNKDLQTKRIDNKKPKHSDSESESDSNTKEKPESLKAVNITQVIKSKSDINKNTNCTDSESESDIEGTQVTVNTKKSHKGLQIKTNANKKRKHSNSESESESESDSNTKEKPESLKAVNITQVINSKSDINKNTNCIDSESESDIEGTQVTVNTKKSHKGLKTKRNANKKPKHSDSELEFESDSELESESDSDCNTKEKQESLKAENIEQGVKPQKDNKKPTAATAKTKSAPKEILKPGSANVLKKVVKPQKDMDQNLKTVISEPESDIDVEGTQECTNKKIDNKDAKIERNNNEKINNSTSDSESSEQETQENLKSRISEKDSKSDVSENSQSIDSESDTDMARIRETVNKTSNKGVNVYSESESDIEGTQKTNNTKIYNKGLKTNGNSNKNLKLSTSESVSDIDIEETQECANKKIDNEGLKIKRVDSKKANVSTSESESDCEKTQESVTTRNFNKDVKSKSELNKNSNSSDFESNMERTLETVNTKIHNKDLEPKSDVNKDSKSITSDCESDEDETQETKNKTNYNKEMENQTDVNEKSIFNIAETESGQEEKQKTLKNNRGVPKMNYAKAEKMNNSDTSDFELTLEYGSSHEEKELTINDTGKSNISKGMTKTNAAKKKKLTSPRKAASPVAEVKRELDDLVPKNEKELASSDTEKSNIYKGVKKTSASRNKKLNSPIKAASPVAEVKRELDDFVPENEKELASSDTEKSNITKGVKKTSASGNNEPNSPRKAASPVAEVKRELDGPENEHDGFSSDDSSEEENLNETEISFTHSTYRPTAEEKLKLASIWIELKYPVLPQHKIESTAGTRTLKQRERIAFEKIVNLKRGKFDSSEDKIIKKNWKSFCQDHEWDPKNPKPFLFMKHKCKEFLMSQENRKKFLQRLAHGLPDRCLYSVYHRFKNLFDPHRTCRYTEDEDRIIVDFISSYNAVDERDRKFAELATILKRTRASVWRRCRVLKKKQNAQDNFCHHSK